MATYTVLADAYNYVRKSELAGRLEHITVRRGGTVELDAEAAAAGIESGALAEGEVNPDEVARQQEEEAAAAAAEEEPAVEEEATSSRRRR